MAVQRVVAFVCGFCPRKKRFAAKATAEKHDRKCFHNPTRRACATCDHFSFEKYEHDTGAGGPSCAEGLLNRIPGEPELRADCEGWKMRDAANL